MRAVILSAGTGWHTDELLRALSERGHTGVVVPYEGLRARLGGARNGLTSDGASLLDADVVLARIIPGGSLEQIIYRVDALHWIENRGVPVINSPRTIERCVDKFYTSTLLLDAGLPTPETVVCERVDEAMNAFAALGDVVIKPIFGSLGHGLVRVDDEGVALRVVRALAKVGSVFYLQRTLDHDGRDLRAFVVGGRVVAAIARHAPPGEWRTNVAIGGRAEAVTLPAPVNDLAVRAARAVGADHAGVDLLTDRSGTTWVIEVNGIPGWRGLQQASGVDVARLLVEQAERRIQAAASSPAAQPLPA